MSRPWLWADLMKDWQFSCHPIIFCNNSQAYSYKFKRFFLEFMYTVCEDAYTAKYTHTQIQERPFRVIGVYSQYDSKHMIPLLYKYIYFLDIQWGVQMWNETNFHTFSMRIPSNSHSLIYGHIQSSLRRLLKLDINIATTWHMAGYIHTDFKFFFHSLFDLLCLTSNILLNIQ